MSKPIAVLISDIHFSVPTLEEAAQSLLKAQFKAVMLDVPLVIAGDLLDSKAIIRAECANKLIQMMSVNDAPETIIIVGNHDLCNEKGKEHALNFLKPYCVIVDEPKHGTLNGKECMLIPYQSDSNIIRTLLEETNAEHYDRDLDDPDIELEDLGWYKQRHLQDRIIIMHQGVQGALAGDYIVDKSAIPAEWLDGYIVHSGHYHNRHGIYIGNPYTLGFSEANNAEKGFKVLMDDGTAEFVPTNLRKHIIFDINVHELETLPCPVVKNIDLVKVKLTGTKEELNNWNKQKVSNLLDLKIDFQLEFNYLDQESKIEQKMEFNQPELLDQLIDLMTNTSNEQKSRLKELWRKSLN